jgi:hypothetical protein
LNEKLPARIEGSRTDAVFLSEHVIERLRQLASSLITPMVKRQLAPDFINLAPPRRYVPAGFA